jgi:hypothetical protein
MVIDCEFNDVFLSMLPPKHVVEQRRRGITLTELNRDMSVAQLQQYECRVHVPGSVMPVLVLGKLHAMIRGWEASVIVMGERLVMAFDGGHQIALRPLGNDRFGFLGLSNRCIREFRLEDDAVAHVTFVIRGVQADLARACLGIARGEPLPEQRIPIVLLRP